MNGILEEHAMKRVVTLAILMLNSVWLLAAPSKIAPDLKGRHAESVDVIVQFTSGATPDAHQRKITNHGGQIKNDLYSIHGFAASMPADAIADLARDPEVHYISPDRKLGSFLDNTAAAVNAPVAWSLGLDGSGIGVAVVDSGVASRPDLNDLTGNSRVVYSQSFVAGNSTTSDQLGHGSHVAGIVASAGYQSTGAQYLRTFKGIAPKAQIINLRVLDQNGAGSDSAVIAAIQQAISLKSQYNIRVINLSLGRPYFENYTLDPLCQAAEAAWKNGIVVVVAAGNYGRDNSNGTNGYSTITAPGNDPYVITVGAMKTMGTPTRADDLIASYSSKGPTLIDHIIKPDLVAPGNMVASVLGSGTLINNYPNNTVSQSYYVTVGSLN